MMSPFREKMNRVFLFIPLFACNSHNAKQTPPEPSSVALATGYFPATERETRRHSERESGVPIFPFPELAVLFG